MEEVVELNARDSLLIDLTDMGSPLFSSRAMEGKSFFTKDGCGLTAQDIKEWIKDCDVDGLGEADREFVRPPQSSLALCGASTMPSQHRAILERCSSEDGAG